MKFLTIDEFNKMKFYELDDITFEKIENEMIRRFGERVTKVLIAKFLEKTIQELSCNSYFDVMSFITIF